MTPSPGLLIAASRLELRSTHYVLWVVRRVPAPSPINEFAGAPSMSVEKP